MKKIKFRYYIDPNTKKPHIYKHNVSKLDIEEFFLESKYIEDKRKDKKSFQAISKLLSGRYLDVIFVKESNNVYFIITAFDTYDHIYIEKLENFLDEVPDDESY